MHFSSIIYLFVTIEQMGKKVHRQSIIQSHQIFSTFDEFALFETSTAPWQFETLGWYKVHCWPMSFNYVRNQENKALLQGVKCTNDDKMKIRQNIIQSLGQSFLTLPSKLHPLTWLLRGRCALSTRYFGN